MNNPTPPQKNNNLWWFMGLLAVLLLMVGSMIFLYNSIKPHQGPIFRMEKKWKAQKKKHKVFPISSYQPAPALVLAKGKKLFAQHCLLCHGKEGMGDGMGAQNLSPKPTPYVWGEFRYGNSVKDILDIITKGSPNRSSGMISWSWMPKKQREALAHYILHLSYLNAKKVAPKRPTPKRTKPTPARTTPDTRRPAPTPKR
jgi:mono/diheme cytochrome c family protein